MRRRLQCRLTPTMTGDDGVGIFSVIGAKRREMRSGQGTKGGRERGEACLPPLQKPVTATSGLLYAGKIENWLPYRQLVTRLEMIPKSHHGRDSPQTLCWE